MKGNKFMKWEIRYYVDERHYKLGIVAFKEIVYGDRNYVISYAQRKVNSSSYKYYDFVQK